MRDLFDELMRGQTVDPTEAARRSLRKNLRRRFYTSASAGADHALLLDGKPVMTPKRRPLKAPNDAIAQLLAEEWNAQREVIDPSHMPITRLANAIIDGVADAPDAVRGEIENYLGSDLICYRADTPAGLVARQAQLWDPLIDFARDTLGARFVLAQGVVHQPQPRNCVAAAAKAIPYGRSPEAIWRLGALAAITSITGSALIALALGAGQIGAEQAWAAAQVDEDWQMDKWGRDAEAMARRDAKRAEFDAAALVLRAVPA